MSALLEKFAEKSGKSIDELYQIWTEAKEAAVGRNLQENSSQFLLYALAITKRRAGLEESLEEFYAWVLDIVLLEAEVAKEEPLPADLARVPGSPPPKPEAPKNDKGETLLAQFARKKGMSEFQVEQIWNNVKLRGELWQVKNKATDQETLEHSMKVFQDVMQLIPDAPPPEATIQPVESEEEGGEESVPGGPGAKAAGGGGAGTPKNPDAGGQTADEVNKREEKAKSKEEKKDDTKQKKDRESRDKQDAENKKSTEEKIKSRKEKQKESLEKIEVALESASSKRRIGGNVISIADLRALKKAGFTDKDFQEFKKLGGTSKEIKKVITDAKKRNRKRAKVGKSSRKLGLLGMVGVGAVGFAAGVAISKAFDKAFDVFSGTTGNPAFQSGRGRTLRNPSG